MRATVALDEMLRIYLEDVTVPHCVPGVCEATGLPPGSVHGLTSRLVDERSLVEVAAPAGMARHRTGRQPLWYLLTEPGVERALAIVARRDGRAAQRVTYRPAIL